MDLRLRQLRVVAMVADERSFTRAGVRLRLSQQSVSSLVRDLEKRLGTVLFVRTTRSVEPTAACEALVAGIRPALQILDAAFETASRTPPARPLVVAITPSIAYGELTVLLESLEGRQAEPAFREVWADDIGPGLADGRFDGAICIETLPLAGLDVVPWRRQRVDLLVSAAHRFARRSEVGVGELHGSVLIIPGEGSNQHLRELVANSVRGAGATVDLRDAPRVAGPAPIAVERGEAATIWLTGMQDRYLPAGLVRVPLRDPETWVVSHFISRARDDAPISEDFCIFLAALADTSNL